MECSICYNEINGATGKVELSCSHPYHLTCIAKWFDKQRLDGSCENCPLCRNTASEYERMPTGIQEEDAEYEGFFDWMNVIDYPPASLVPLELDGEGWLDNIAPPSPRTLPLSVTEQPSTTLLDQLTATKTKEEVENYAASLIKACWRGYQDRLLSNSLREVKSDIHCSIKIINRVTRAIEKQEQNLVVAYKRKKFLNSTIGLSRSQVKTMAATKIQALWRRYTVRLMLTNGPVANVELHGLWRKTTLMKWEKIIMNPEEDMPACIIMHPLSTVA